MIFKNLKRKIFKTSIFALTLLLASCKFGNQTKDYVPVADFKTQGAYKSVVLTWTNTDDGDITELVIDYGTSTNQMTSSKNLKPTVSTCTIDNLKNNTAYYFTVSKIYSDESRVTTTIHKTTTVNPLSISEEKAVASGTDKITLTWKNPAADYFSGTEVYFGDSKTSLKLVKTLAKNVSSFEISELTENTTYFAKIKTVYIDKDVSEGTVISATTEKAPANNSDDNNNQGNNNNNNNDDNNQGNNNNNDDNNNNNNNDPEPPISEGTDPYANLSSVNFAKATTIGWNLGNTFDANEETGWGAPVTTEAMIKAVHAAGFKTIRIPISWHYHLTDANYTIDSAYMNRVKQVVTWAYNDGMFVIINIHHDNMTPAELSTTPGFALSPDAAIQTKSKDYITKIWTQIATEFADYNSRLIFEVLNEPRDIGGEIWGNEWSCSGTSGKEACNIITAYEQAAINAIRAVSGNENRFLMVPGYAASGSDIGMLNCYTMPTDSATDKLILSTHAYSPYDFAMKDMTDTVFGKDDQSALDSIFGNLYTKYTSKGIGIIMGEASAENKDNLSEREKWFTYYFGEAYKKGISTVLWDNFVYDVDYENNGEHHGYFVRQSCDWYFPTLIEKAMEAVGVTGYSIPAYVPLTPASIGWDSSKATILSNKEVTLGWNNNFKITTSQLSGIKEGSILKVTVKNAGMSFRLINGSWSINYNQGTVVNGTAGENISSSATEVYYVFTAQDAANLKSSDMYIVGPETNIITKVEFQP